MDDIEALFDSSSVKVCGFCKTSQRYQTYDDFYNHINACRLIYEKFSASINALIEKTDPEKNYILIIPGYVSVIKGDDAKISLKELNTLKTWAVLRKSSPGSSICLIPIQEDMVVII